MKNKIITELVGFRTKEEVTDEILKAKADLLNAFQKTQDGFINGELVNGLAENDHFFIYHYENMEKVKAIGEKLRISPEFGEFMKVVMPGSLAISFYSQEKMW